MWTKMWPVEPGWYWFWGDPFGSKEVRPEFIRYYAVRVARGANSWIRICEGHFMYESEASDGLWTPITMPAVAPSWEKEYYA